MFNYYGNNQKSIYDDKYAADYRKNDESMKDDPNYWILKDFLTRYLNKINGRKSILDLGCGTGRYFHLFDGKEIDRFVGIDISKSMLNIAKNSPPFVSEITIKNIELIEGNFLSITNIGKFDFVYSIGVIGEHIPFNKRVVDKIVLEFLKPGGFFIFTAVCWFYRSFKRRLINKFFEKTCLIDIGPKSGFYKNFFTDDFEIVKSMGDDLNLLELNLLTHNYPHYLVAVQKKTII